MKVLGKVRGVVPAACSRWIGPISLLVALAAPSLAHAMVWPDVAERIERDLQSGDPAARKSAARQLARLGPSRGVPLALQALADSDDDVRIAAADAAIRLRATGATPVVAGWFNAPDPRIRRKACDVARALPNVSAIAPLSRSLGDPDSEVRAAAAEALGHQKSGDAVPPLLGRLDDAAPTTRIRIVEALARLGDGRAVVPLVGKVQDSSPEVRQAVARALGTLGDRRASPALVLALRDQNTDVRRDALVALGRLSAIDAVDAIAPFVSDRTPALRLAALGALGHIASADAVRVLVGALGVAEDASGTLERTPVRDALVTAAATAIGPLHSLLTGSPSPPTATSAAWVLGALHATGEAPTIVASMRRGVLPTAAALHALIGVGTSADVSVVLEFVADPSPLVRDEALAAAGALLDPRHPDGRAVEPLAAALRDARPSPAQRAQIASLLGRTGAPRAAPLLVELTHTSHTSLRLSAVDALGTLGPNQSPAADDALLEALGAPDPVLRLRAAIALGSAGGARAREVLLDRLAGGDEIDRAAVLTALGGILTRDSTDSAVARLAEALDLAAGPERDAILDAMGRASSRAAAVAISRASKNFEASDRREVALVLAAHPESPAAVDAARALLGDPEGGVRAQAAWTLGTIGNASDEGRLLALINTPLVDAATNATAALGRISARLHAPDMAGRTLCPRIDDVRPSVRANALAGLGLAAARCGDGSAERRALSDDPNDDVRMAAARAVGSSGHESNLRALERCALTDPSGPVATRCRDSRQQSSPAGPPHALLAYVIADGSQVPRPGSAYMLRMADGLLHAGTTDRRGAVFDPAAPDGDVSLTSSRP